jgi:hypothetical protein
MDTTILVALFTAAAGGLWFIAEKHPAKFDVAGLTVIVALGVIFAGENVWNVSNETSVGAMLSVKGLPGEQIDDMMRAIRERQFGPVLYYAPVAGFFVVAGIGALFQWLRKTPPAAIAPPKEPDSLGEG